MLVIQSFGMALVALFLGLFCWGTWGVMLRSARLDYEVATIYFISAQLGISCLTCFTFGMMPTEVSPEAFVDVFWRVDPFGAVAAGLAGCILGTSNSLLAKASALGGVAVAFPAVLGTGLVGGSVLNFIIEPKGNPELLFSGIFLGVAALLCNGCAYSLRQVEARDVPLRDEEFLASDGAVAADQVKLDSAGGQAEAVQTSRKLFIACAVAGILSMSWSPLSVWASKSRGLCPYEVIFFVHLGQMAMFPVLLARVKSRKLPRGGSGQISMCLAAGVVNGVGRIAMFIAGSAASFAMAFGIVMCSPLVASLWGVALGEMRGSGRRRWALFAATMISYTLAIVCIAASQLEE